MADRDVSRARRLARRPASPPGRRPAGPAENPAENADGEAAAPIADGDQPEKTPLGSMRVAERPNGFPTEATLADQDAEAAELREELDQLRRLLDDGPPPLSPVRRRNRRPLLGVLVSAGVLGVIATAVLLPWSNLDQSGSDPGPAASAGGAPRVSAPPAGPAALRPRPAPSGSLPASGPGIDQPGTIMLVSVGHSGDLNVVEHDLLGPRELSPIELALPSMTTLGGAVAKLDPRVHNLRVSVNGTPVRAVANPGGSDWSVDASAERARTVQLSYRITGTVMRSRPSNAGRALAVSLPLLGQSLREQGLPLVVQTEGIQGSLVNEVSCPGAPARQMLCGTRNDVGWIAAVPTSASSPALLLQLNLRD